MVVVRPIASLFPSIVILGFPKENGLGCMFREGSAGISPPEEC